MTPEEAQARERDMEQVRREMMRKSRDVIRIYNPLDTDFKFFYDGYPNVIKANSTKDVERYKAELYFKKISQYIIGQMGIAKGNELLEERRKRGVPEFLDKYVENREIWDKVPKMDDPVLLKEIADKVILGLVEEYGMDLPENFGPGDAASIEGQPVDTYLSSLLEKRVNDRPVEAPVETAPIKEKLKMEVTADADS